MCRFSSALLSLLIGAGAVAAEQKYPGIGRDATAAEIRAWDIDVRPDFKGLPVGSGSVKEGEKVWETKCAACHGTFGESNDVFTPIVGGTTQEDVKTGRVKALTQADIPRTTLMKLSTVSTLWDYINRAMPWNAPKSLSTGEVYAVVAYILNLGDIVPSDFTLDDRSIRTVQNLLPNRNGMTRGQGLWDVKGKADVHNVACMRNCVTEIKIASVLPGYAAGAHGNLTEQNRSIGPGRDADSAKSAKPVRAVVVTPEDLAAGSGCMVCHAVSGRVVGPSFSEVAAKYKGDGAAVGRLVDKVRKGGAGVWADIPMPPQPTLQEEDVKALVRWVLAGAPQSK